MTTTERRPAAPGPTADEPAPDQPRLPPGSRPHPTPPLWRGRYLLFAVGIAMIFLGVKGIYHNDHNWEQPHIWVKLFIGSALVHDLIVAPAVAVLSIVLLRVVPALYRPPLQVGLFAAAAVALVSVPGVGGYGITPGNPTIHPLDYGLGLGISLAVIALFTLAGEAFVVLRHRRAGADD